MLLSGIATALAASGVLVLVKKLSHTESAATLLFWFTLAITLGPLGSAVAVWQTPDLRQLAVLLAVGGWANLAQYLTFRAYRIGEAGAISPMDYTQLLWASLISTISFNEPPGLFTCVGAGLVVASTFYILQRNR